MININFCLYTDFSGQAFQDIGLKPTDNWDCELEFHWGRRCLPLVLVVCVRPADHSFRGVLLCVSKCVWFRKYLKREGLYPIWAIVPQNKNCLYVCIKIFSTLSEYTAIHEARISPSLVEYVIESTFIQRKKHAEDLLIVSSRM
jgi:hypothetical protein